MTTTRYRNELAAEADRQRRLQAEAPLKHELIGALWDMLSSTSEQARRDAIEQVIFEVGTIRGEIGRGDVDAVVERLKGIG